MKRSIAALITALFSLTVCADNEKEIKILINTDLGKITVKLYNETPQHRDNFIKLVNERKYNGVLFHRVIKQFMIQAGDVTSVNAPADKKLGAGDLEYTIPAEIVYPKYFHKAGRLAAARIGDDKNAERASSASQFYIVTGKHFSDYELNKMEKENGKKLTSEEREAYKIEGGAPHLDGAYTVFGEVVKGMNVVRKIELLETDSNDRPRKNIKIKTMKILK
ncbi:MAG: peptidylprolyl isomerase [Tannerella sp.]|jgi:peptidylprolyl isomerase/peptidyl-prolyl cis-trans isomerase B (cyclophilin B)|nr:peptidylprolyl isomerase [Tannerella sp.]